MVKAQGGDEGYIYDTSKFERAKFSFELLSGKRAMLTEVDALSVGKASMSLGAGRQKKDSAIDHARWSRPRCKTRG
jgi:pyrimidine-nucleoside phosphorylase